MDKILNHIRIHSALVRGEAVSTRVGLVDGYDPKTYSCKVRLLPEDLDDPAATLTGWLPISTAWAGDGFGAYAPPARGQMVMVHFVDGDIESGVVGLSMFNNSAKPLNVPQGECWLVHKSGSFLKFLGDGTISTNATINHKGGLNIDGNITCTGDVSDKKGSMDVMRNKHNEHTHTGDGKADPPAPTSAPITGVMT